MESQLVKRDTQDAIWRLVQTDATIAQAAIEDAIDEGGKQRLIEKASESLEKAKAAVDSGEFPDAVKLFAQAWRNAIQSTQYVSDWFR